MQNRNSLRISDIWLLTAIFLVQPVAAQESSRSTVLEEVVVTSGRIESVLQDTPQAVSAFDATEIERRQSFNVVDVVNNVPNLVGNNNIGQSSATTVFLRGVGTTESIVTIDTAMGFYVDDVYVARQGVNNFSLYDIERVEVLRGPQGTLYGRNTSAGAIKVITAKPDEDFEASGEASFGEYSRWNLKGSVNAPLIDDSLFLRVTGLVQQGDGYTDNVTLGREVNDRDVWGLRGALRWVANPDLEFLLTLDHSESEDAGLYAYDVSGITRPPTGDLFTSISGTDTTNIGEQEGVALTVDWSPSDAFQLQSITSFRNTYQKWNLDLTDQVVPIFLLWTINDSDQFSQEIKIFGDLMNDRLHYVGGVFYFDEDSYSFIGDDFVAFRGAPFPTYLRRDYDVETESWAIYADFTYDITDQLSLIFGGRYTEDDKSLDIVQTVGGTPGFENIGGGPGYDNSTLEALGIPTNLDFSEFTPKLGVQYAFSEDLQAYLTYQEGFKSGGWSARTNTPEELVTFVPEIIGSYALGAKWTTWDGRARINAEGFYYDYQDLFNTGTGAMGNFIVATNDAEIKGIEVESTVRFTDNLDGYGFIAWQDGEYKSVDPDAAFVGGELQRLPEWNYELGLTYRYPVGPGELIANGSYSYQDDHFTNLQNTELARSNDINLVDATLGWETNDGRYYVGVSCRNCFDDEYIVQSLDFAGFGFITVYPGEPRTWLLTLRARTGN
jgi:iron complex outermembrane receptor protein